MHVETVLKMSFTIGKSGNHLCNLQKENGPPVCGRNLDHSMALKIHSNSMMVAEEMIYQSMLK